MSDVLIDAEGGIASRKELSEERKVKRLTAIVLVLLILLAILLLLYIMFFREKQVPTSPGINWLFSIYGLKSPHGVSADADRNAYIGDTGNHRFLVFNKEGQFVKEIGKRGAKDGFYAPYGSYVDNKAGKIYICDWTARQVIVVSKAGKRLSTFPKKPFGKEYGPKGFTPYQIAEYKGRLYVVSNSGVFVFNKNGKLLENWGERGNKAGQFMFPNGIAVDQKTGNVFVADSLNRRVVSLTNKGKVRWIIGRPDKLVKAKKGPGRVGKIVSFFQLPRSVAISPDGYLFVTDTFANHIVVLTVDGELVSVMGKRGVEDGTFNFPEGIAFRDDGVAYVADRVNDRVQAIEFIEPFPKPDSDKRRQHKSQFNKY